MDKAFSDPEGHTAVYGVLPSVEDYGIPFLLIKVSLMESILERRMPGLLGEHCIGMEDISMKHFYNNVNRVVQRGFWFEPRPPKTITPKECEMNHKTFQYISIALMVDYSTDGNDPQQRADKFSALLKSLAVWTTDIDPFTYTAEEWLYVYDKMVPHETRRQEDSERARTVAKLDFHEWMRETLNTADAALKNLNLAKKST